MTRIEIGKTYKFDIFWSPANASFILRYRHDNKPVFLNYKNALGTVKNLIHHDLCQYVTRCVSGEVIEIDRYDLYNAIMLSEESVRVIE
jgi:hypothetical protein